MWQFWPYLIWLHHPSQVGERAGTIDRTSLRVGHQWQSIPRFLTLLLALPSPAPQPQKRQPSGQKSTVQKWHPPGKPCSLSLLRHCSDPWQIWVAAIAMAAMAAGQFSLVTCNWGGNAAAKLVLHDFLQFKSHDWNDCWNCEAAICNPRVQGGCGLLKKRWLKNNMQIYQMKRHRVR